MTGGSAGIWIAGAGGAVMRLGRGLDGGRRSSGSGCAGATLLLAVRALPGGEARPAPQQETCLFELPDPRRDAPKSNPQRDHGEERG